MMDVRSGLRPLGTARVVLVLAALLVAGCGGSRLSRPPATEPPDPDEESEPAAASTGDPWPLFRWPPPRMRPPSSDRPDWLPTLPENLPRIPMPADGFMDDRADARRDVAPNFATDAG
jgi:hypothetical protein